jgi:hypothetical protein
VSLDAVDPANDYQRAGGSYLQTLANAERYKELIENCIIFTI